MEEIIDKIRMSLESTQEHSVNSNLTELFECLDAVINDYCTTYDPHEDRESVMATVSTQKIVDLHEAYNRCKEQAHAMNHTFMPMDSAPRDGTMVLKKCRLPPCG